MIFDIEAGANTFRLHRVIDDMRRLIEKYPGGYEDWVRQRETAAAPTAQDGSEAKAKAPAAAEVAQLLQPGASEVAIVHAISSVVNGPAAGFEDPGILEKDLSNMADNHPAAPVKGVAEPAVKDQAPVAQAPRADVIPATETAPAPEVGERILKGPAAGADPSTTDVTAPLQRPPTVPISLPFASPRPPLAVSTPAVVDDPAAAPPNLVQLPSALPTLPATTFNPAAAPSLSVTPPTPLTPRGPRARVESPLIDSPAPQPNSLDPVAELPASGEDDVF